MSFTGGTVDRAVHQSVFNFVKNHLTTIGWFQSGRNHQPINLISGRPKPEAKDTVPVNTVALVDEEVKSEPYEMGTDASQNCYKFSLEMYAENESVGRQLMGDVRRLLAGAYPGLSVYPMIDLYDTSQTPSVYVRSMDVCDIAWSHPAGKELYQRFLFKVEWNVVDYDV